MCVCVCVYALPCSRRASCSRWMRACRPVQHRPWFGTPIACTAMSAAWATAFHCRSCCPGMQHVLAKCYPIQTHSRHTISQTKPEPCVQDWQGSTDKKLNSRYRWEMRSRTSENRGYDQSVFFQDGICWSEKNDDKFNCFPQGRSFNLPVWLQFIVWL